MIKCPYTKQVSTKDVQTQIRLGKPSCDRRILTHGNFAGTHLCIYTAIRVYPLMTNKNIRQESINVNTLLKYIFN